MEESISIHFESLEILKEGVSSNEEPAQNIEIDSVKFKELIKSYKTQIIDLSRKLKEKEEKIDELIQKNESHVKNSTQMRTMFQSEMFVQKKLIEKLKTQLVEMGS